MSALVVLVALVGLISFVLRGARPVSGPGVHGARRWQDLKRYRSPDEALAWAAPLMGLLAWLSLAPRQQDVLPVAVMYGLVTGAMARRGRGVRDLALSVVGVLASVVVGFAYLASDQLCGPSSTSVRALALVCAIACFCVGGLVGFFLRRGRAATFGLEVFAVIEVLVLAATPLGDDLFSGSAVLAGLAVGLLALIVSLMGEAALGVIAIAVAGVGLLMSDLFGTGCQLPGFPSGSVAVVVFVVGYVFSAWLASRVAG
jgi:hypothetical protein